MPAIPNNCVVLVVEDEWLVQALMVDELQEAGFSVLTAASGEEALALLESGSPVDVLFTDVRLGGELNGWDVAEAFRKVCPHIAVIYTSGYSINPRRDVDDSLFFRKPYNPVEIVDACIRLGGKTKGKA